MHVSPADLSVSDLRTALVSGWRIEPSSIAYAPVGFGSHHWTVVEPSSRRWFVTADAVTDSSTRLIESEGLAVILSETTNPKGRARKETPDRQMSWHRFGYAAERRNLTSSGTMTSGAGP